MMYNNLKILFRGLFRKALYAWLNIIGLSVGLTAAIFMFLWVYDEWNYDKFYSRTDDIYIVHDHRIRNGVEEYSDVFPVPLARAAEVEVAGVEAATTLGSEWFLGSLDYNGEKYFPTGFGDFKRADSSFFRVFDMEFIEGTPQNAFPDKSSIILTDETATILFGNESAFGKALKGNDGNIYRVTGVVKKSPQNSIVQFKALLSFEGTGRMRNWGQWTSHSFVLLNPNADVKKVAENITKVHEKNAQDFKADFPHLLQPLGKYHLYNADGSETGMKNVRLFSIIAIALLGIACINYVNLVTSRAQRRAKEIGLRKVVGAGRLRLFVQMLSETIILFLISMAIATVLLYLLTPHYAKLTGKELVFNVFDSNILLLYLLCFLFIVVLAGIYPAIFLSSFKPLEVFKNKKSEQKNRISFRQLLIILQFACSAALILATIVMSAQQRYMQTKSLGFDKENVFTVDVLAVPGAAKHFEAFRQELEKHPEIIGAAMTESSIQDNGNFSGFSWSGATPDVELSTSVLGIDRTLFSLLNLQIAEGEGFSGTSADSLCLFVNEALVKQMGIEDPLNTTISASGWRLEGKITGVIKDFHFRHMREPIGPVVMYLAPYKGMWTIYVKVAAGKTREALALTEQVWKKSNPDYPLAYKFMDETFDIMYRNDIRARNLFNTFAIVAIFISCLGLFGLATYTAETRTKEIGIRKTLGASMANIVGMLSREFVVLAGIACAIGIPIAYYFMNKMLQSYAYHISITWWMIFAAILAVLILTILTVSAQALRAARANPVKSIKTE